MNAPKRVTVLDLIRMLQQLPASATVCQYGGEEVDGQLVLQVRAPTHHERERVIVDGLGTAEIVRDVVIL